MIPMHENSFWSRRDPRTSISASSGPTRALAQARDNSTLGQSRASCETGKIVLIRKEGRLAESPSIYRPTVLLDEVGKFER